MDAVIGPIILFLSVVRVRHSKTPMGIPNKMGDKKEIPLIPPIIRTLASILFFLENTLNLPGNFFMIYFSIFDPKKENRDAERIPPISVSKIIIGDVQIIAE